MNSPAIGRGRANADSVGVSGYRTEEAYELRRDEADMADAKTIREAAERSAEASTRKPSRGRLTGVTKARMVDGLLCEIDDRPWTLRADMPVKAGGTERAPAPGILGCGALASCLVIGISTWAARRRIAF